MTAEEKNNNNSDATAKRILMIVGDYSEDYEVMVPFQTLVSCGYRVDAVCPGKKSGDSIKTCIHDFEGDQTYSEKRGHNFVLTHDFAAIAEDKQALAGYCGLVIPGGRAPEYLSINEQVIAVVSHFTANDLPLACICHGILILFVVQNKSGGSFLSERNVTCYPACSPVVVASGGKFQAPEPITTAFTDGKLVTAAAWPAHPQWMAQFLAVLGANITYAQSKKPRVLMIAGDYVEDYEVMCPFQMLGAMGVAVDVVCPDKKAGESVRTCVHDFEGAQTYSEKPGHNFALNATFDAIDVESYDGLYVPGGRAPEYLSLNERVLAMVNHFVKAEKPIASICHGQLILAATAALKGKKCTAYPACKPVVELAGGQWQDPEPITAAFTDGKLVTAAAWPAHPEIVKQFIAQLGMKITI